MWIVCENCSEPGATKGEVEERLDGLESIHAFVRSLGERELSDGRLSRHCRFVHALYQNALYAQLGPGKRASLARSIADALLHAWAGNESAIATELAFLFETSRDFERAAHFYLIAARNAGRLFANQEAVDTATRGLRMLEFLPAGAERDRRELALRLSLGSPLMMLKGYSARDPADNFVRVQELSAGVAATDELFEIRFLVWLGSVVAGNFGSLLQLGSELMEMARATGDPGKIMCAYFSLVVTNAHMGRLRAALDFANEASSLRGDPVPPPYPASLEPVAAIQAEAVRIVWAMGFPDEALRRAEANVERARAIQHPETLAFALVFYAFVHQFRREPYETLTRAEQAMALCDEHGLAQTRAWAAPVHGWALVMTGRHDEGLAELRACVAAHAAMQSRVVVPYFHSLLAESLSVNGDVDAALAVVDEGLAMAAATLQAFHEIELNRLRGELLMAKGATHREQAERYLRRAIDLAREQEARSYELRAATVLARMMAAAGQRAEARGLLAPISESFTEGLETPDVQEAARLLASLTA